MDESRIDPELIPDDIELSPGENVSGVLKCGGATLIATNRRIINRRKAGLFRSDEDIYPIRTTSGIHVRTRPQEKVLGVGAFVGLLGLVLMVMAFGEAFSFGMLLIGLILALGGVATAYFLGIQTQVVIRHGNAEETTITTSGLRKQDAQRFAQTVSRNIGDHAW